MLLASLLRRLVFNLNLILVKDLYTVLRIGVLTFSVLVNRFLFIVINSDVLDGFVGFNVDVVRVVLDRLRELCGVL